MTNFCDKVIPVRKNVPKFSIFESGRCRLNILGPPFIIALSTKPLLKLKIGLTLSKCPILPQYISTKHIISLPPLQTVSLKPLRLDSDLLAVAAAANGDALPPPQTLQEQSCTPHPIASFLKRRHSPMRPDTQLSQCLVPRCRPSSAQYVSLRRTNGPTTRQITPFKADFYPALVAFTSQSPPSPPPPPIPQELHTFVPGPASPPQRDVYEDRSKVCAPIHIQTNRKHVQNHDH